MKTKKSVRKLLSLLMIFALLCTCGGLSAFATVDHAESTGGVTAVDEVFNNNNIYMNGAEALPSGSESYAEVNVEKSVTVSNPNGGNNGADAYSFPGTTAVVNVGEDVLVTGTETSKGAQADAINGGTAQVRVGGDVYTNVATDSEGHEKAIGIQVIAYGTDSEPNATVDVHGTVTADADGYAEAEGTMVTADGGLAVANTGEISAISDKGISEGVYSFTGTSGEVVANTHDGDIRAESLDNWATGISAENNGNTVINTGDGDVYAKGEMADGIIAISYDGELKISVENVEAVTTEDGSSAMGVHVKAYDDGEAHVTADEVSASAPSAVGVKLHSQNGASADVTANEIIALAKKDSNGADGHAVGAKLSAQGAEGAGANLDVNGDIKADTVGVELSAMDQNGVYVTADNITGGDVGLSFVRLEEDAHAFASVQEVIHGDNIGILVNQLVTAENVEIAVWKIDTVEVDGEDHVALEEASGQRSVTKLSQTVEEKIQYLIKVQDDQKDIIKEVDGAILYPFIEEGSVGSATEGTKLTLKKLNLPEGCELTGAYNGQNGDKVELLTDADGNYYYVVPRGGGVILSVTWDKTSGGGEDPNPDNPGGGDNPSGAIWTNGVAYVDITFDFNGGHRLASLFTGPVVKRVPAGTWAVLIDPPVKEGADFLGWISDSDHVTVTKPGQNFCAMENVIFKASWSDNPVSTAAEQKAAQAEAERNAALAEAIAQSETVVASADELQDGQAVPADEAHAMTATSPKTGDDSSPAAISLGGDGSAALSLAGLMSADSSGLSAKLVIDLGGGSALEIPVDIQLSFGTPALVMTGDGNG